MVNIGCTLNSSNAEMNSVKAYSAGTSAKNADCSASFGDDGEELRSREVIGLKTVTFWPTSAICYDARGVNF